MNVCAYMCDFEVEGFQSMSCLEREKGDSIILRVFFEKYTDLETHFDILPVETEIDTQCETALTRLTLKI